MQIKFVQNNSSEELSENLRLAYIALQETNLNPEWVSTEDCLNIKDRNSDVFVCDPFSGPAFEHLKRLKFRILGPQCVVSCVERREPLPKLPYPVYCATMKGIVVSCTSIEKKIRVELHEKIQLMGGEVSGNLTSSVTHLVAGEVGSKKYHVGCNLQKPVMLPEWVFECWKTGLSKNVHATDITYDHMKCPIFKGLHITVSQVDSEERKEVQRIVTNNGGKYSGELRANDTTHLIAIQPEGQKYHYANQWKMHCVTVAWLFDSISKGFCMDESLYRLSVASVNRTKTSTPVAASKNDVQALSNTSSISNASMRSRINETVRSGRFSFNRSTVEDDVHPSSTHPLDGLNISELSKSGSFLDGCKIFFSGFNDIHLEKLRKIVNMGGGTRFSQLCDSVSHVVINTGSSDHIRILENLQVRPCVVSVDWLIESCTVGRQAEVNPFLVVDAEAPAVDAGGLPQPSSKTSKPVNLLSTLSSKSVYEDEVMCQYIQKSALGVDDNACLKVPEENKKEAEFNAEHEKFSINSEHTAHIEEGNPDVAADEDTCGDGIFNGLTFIVLGFDHEDASLLEDMISENKGCVYPLAEVTKPTDSFDYGVVPMLNCDVPLNVTEVVTNFWVQICLEKGECLPLSSNEIFRPLNISVDVKPLSGCVLSISQYLGTERDALVFLIETLGATYQEFFVRKANASSNLIPSTHLVCITAEGSKYKGAVNWGLPAVTKEWLFTCANSRSYVSEEKYLVGVTQKPKSSADRLIVADDVKKCVAEDLNSAAHTFVDASVSNTVAATGENAVVQCSKLGLESEIDGKADSVNSIAKRIFTPARVPRPQLSRIKELIQEDRVSRPVTPENTGVDTPGKFLDPNIPFKPTFDFTEVVQILNSPSSNDISRRRSSILVEDWLGVNLQQAVTQSQQQKCKVPSDVQQGPLSAVIICVSKKLSSEQGELNDIVTALGGDYRWTYDSCCTHFIYKGKTGDMSRELRLPREQGKKIVSPYWLYACKEDKSYQDEELYPFTYNANMKLEVKPTKLNLKPKYKQNSADLLVSKLKDLDDDNSGSDQSGMECSGSVNSVSSSKGNSTSVNRQMELMLATKTGKGNKKRKQASSPFAQPTEITRAGVPVRSETPSKPKEGLPEVSSSVPITWDDPTGRLEREKLAEQLAKESQSLSPDAQHVIVKRIMNEKLAESSNGSNKENDDPPPTASLSRTKSKTILLKQPPRLMLSGMSNQERIDYAALVAELGGSVSEAQHFDNTCTHLVVNQPSRNEKFLGSIAAGKWILHKSYLEACRQERRFVEELPHEWGSEIFSKKIPLTNPQLEKIAQSAHRWRKKLNPMQNKPCSDVMKAFHDWNAIVYTDQQRENSFRRLLEAGGATVVSASFPFSNPINATIAFLELSKAPSREVDLQALIDNGVQCVKPEYIAAFLIEEPPPSIQNFQIPEVDDLLNESDNRTLKGKRRPDNDVAHRTKKTRR